MNVNFQGASADTGSSWEPILGLASQLLDGTGSAVATFGQPYGGMPGPAWSSYGSGFDTFTTPPVTTVAEHEMVESVADDIRPPNAKHHFYAE